MENNHAAIIDPVIHEQVQREMARRGSDHSGVRIFSGKIKCAECGAWYGSKVWHSNDKYRRVIWQCNHKFRGKKCSTPHLTEEEIKNAFLTAVNTVLHGRENAIAAFEIAKTTVFDTTSLELDAEAAEAEMQAVSERMQVLIRENATVAQDQDDYRRRFGELSERFDSAKKRYEDLKSEICDKRTREADIRDYIAFLNSQEGRVTEFSTEMWCGMVDHVTVGGEIVFTFLDGTEVTV